jgi:hypothetical protein
VPKKKNKPENIRGKVARASSRNAKKNPNRSAWGNRGIFKNEKI